MAINPNIILQGRPVNVLGAMDQGTVAGARAYGVRREQQMNNALAQHGSGLLEGDQEAMNAIAQFDPSLVMNVQNTQSTMADRDRRFEFQQSEAERSQSNADRAFGLQSEQFEFTRQQAKAETQRLLREQEAELDREQLAREAEQDARAAATLSTIQTPEQYAELAPGIFESIGEDMPDFEDLAPTIAALEGGTEAAREFLEAQQEPEKSYIATGDQAAALGLEPEYSYNITSGPEGMSASRIGGSGQTINVNNGANGIDYGAPPTNEAWKRDADGNVVLDERGAPVSLPIGQAYRDQQAAAEGAQNTRAQGQLMLGTTLESINLNIDEIENEGLPVTGAMGDLRRTALGRLFTGSDAFDFGNRTNQITDSAALAEIQRMRDNSPTGGAVGQLTDSERVAIGNAVTALNASTSAEEYLRAAKDYRELALNYAYGEGLWTLNDDGSVSAISDGDAQPAESTGTDPNDPLGLR